MARVTTFSRHFPGHHPRNPEHTYFVEQILNSLKIPFRQDWYWCELQRLNPDVNVTILSKFFNSLYWDEYKTKGHTIRTGQTWTPGMIFSPRVWSGKPYNSPQIQFAPDVTLKSVCDFEMDLNGVYSINGKYIDEQVVKQLAKNDGLTEDDLFHWFMRNYNKPNEFKGQIRIWDESINYKI